MTPYQRGRDFFACGLPIVVRMVDGETHVFSDSGEKLSESDMTCGNVYGGGEGLELESVSVTVESGLLQAVYGGGVNDIVHNSFIRMSGGAVRIRICGGGMAKTVGNVEIVLDNVATRYVTTGSFLKDSHQKGNSVVTMNGGVLLGIRCGGEGTTVGNCTVTVNGGRVEKQIVDLSVDGSIKVSLPENIFVPNSSGTVFPMLPEKAEITYTAPVEYEEIVMPPENEDEFFKATQGRLEVRFFELRDPKLKRTDSPFPQFIGDCILITEPSGGVMLIDTGLKYSESEVVNGIKRLGIERLDYLVLTHFHSDHMGNAVALLDNFKVGAVVFPDVCIAPDPVIQDEYDEVMRRIDSGEQKLIKIAEGDFLTMGEASFEVLNPETRGDVGVGLNNSSIVLKMTYCENTALFTGDIGDAIELRLVGKYGDALKCDLLKSAHHAITTQNHYEFINACSPQYVMIHNLRPKGTFMTVTGYSLREVNRLDPESIYSTGRHGAVKFQFDGTSDGIKVWTQYDVKGEVK